MQNQKTNKTTAPFLIFSLMFSFLLTLSACKKNTVPQATQAAAQANSPIKLKTTEILGGQEIIWGMDWLPNGDLLFTERKGNIKKFANGSITTITGLPTDIEAKNQGGLLDLKVHPNYAQNGWIYITYAAAEAGVTCEKLSRFKLKNNEVTDLEVIYKASATNKWRGHYGSRIAFGNDGKLYVAIGEGGATSRGGRNSANQNAQTVTEGWGKVHRMNDDGSVPADNPILPGLTAATTVYSYGHRNPQGLVVNPATGDIYDAEHGPKGGDEINLIKKGANYGWPWISYGVNYDGVTVSDSPSMAGMVEPIHYYLPSIGTCGMVFVNKSKFTSWQGNLLVGSLAANHVSRVVLKDNKVVSQEKILEGIGRVRNVKQGPDGNFYVSVENPGRIIKIEQE
jgi:aldose sugar dehydrogenase